MNYSEFEKIILCNDFGFFGLSAKNDKSVTIYVECVDEEVYEVTTCNKTLPCESKTKLLELEVYDGKTFKDLWDELNFDFIDGELPEDYLENLKSNFMLDFTYKLSHGERIDFYELKSLLLAKEKSGDLILYSGTCEIKDIKENSPFFLCITLPDQTAYYIENDDLLKIKTVFLFDKTEKRKVLAKTKNSAGRVKDNFKKDKSNTNQQYNDFMDLEKLENKSTGLTYFISYAVLVALLFARFAIRDEKLIYLFVIMVAYLLFFSIIKIIQNRNDKRYAELSQRMQTSDRVQNLTKMFESAKIEMQKNEFLSLENKISHKFGIGFKKIAQTDDDSLSCLFSGRYVKITVLFFNALVVITEDSNEENTPFIRIPHGDFTTFDELENIIVENAFLISHQHN